MLLVTGVEVDGLIRAAGLAFAPYQSCFCEVAVSSERAVIVVYLEFDAIVFFTSIATLNSFMPTFMPLSVAWL
jgi:hypothetical protein